MGHENDIDPAVPTEVSDGDPALAGMATRIGPGGPAERALAHGQAVGRYVIEGRVGAGAMGVVYGAYDPELNRKVALKLLKAGADDPAARARLLREGRAMARLSHPHVVAVFDVGTLGDEVFVAMEFVDGQTLRQWLHARERQWREVLAVFQAVGRGLTAAHEAGLVHRDLKPDNIMVGADGRVRVMDFGLARTPADIPQERASAASSPSERGSASELTRTGSLVGTPPYMAPEQWNGAVADARSDQFAFCVALWEALYGERPFQGDTVPALMLAITGGSITEPRAPGRVPMWLRRLVERGLAVAPAARWGSVAELLTALAAGDERHAEPSRVRTASKGVAGLALGQLLVSPICLTVTGPGESMGVLVGDLKFPSALLTMVPAAVGCALILRTRVAQRGVGALALLGGLGLFASVLGNYSPFVLELLGVGPADPPVPWDRMGFGLHLVLSAGVCTMAAGAMHMVDGRRLAERLTTLWSARLSARVVRVALAVFACAVAVAVGLSLMAPPIPLRVHGDDPLDAPAPETPAPPPEPEPRR